MSDVLQSLTVVKQRFFGSFTFDATLSESHRVSNTITQQPVELGADLTDHAFSQPTKVVIVGEVSDTPSQPNESFDNGTSDARSSSAFDQIVSLAKSRELFSIQTGLALYNNMLIEDLSTRQNSTTANTMIVRLSCIQIKTVTINTTSVPAEFLSPGKTSDNASQTVTQGDKQTVPPDETQQKVADSAALSLTKLF